MYEVSVIGSVSVKVYEKGVRMWDAQEGDMKVL